MGITLFSKQQLIPSIICGLACFISVVTCITISTSNTTYVLKGSDFTLCCEVEGLGFHMWFKDGKPIVSDSINKFVLKQDPTIYSPKERKYFTSLHLIVNNADSVHSGVYKCNSDGLYSHHVIVINENLLVTNEEEPGMGKILIPEEPLLLQCTASECVQCKVVWYKDGERLHPIPDHLEFFENNSFVITSANYDDAGIYMCAIDEDQLQIKSNATIVVQSKIKLDKFETSSVVVEGSPLELYCSVKGSPTPYIKWFIGDKEIYEDDERIKLLDHNGLKKGKLLIEEADYPDRNHYTCEAFNQVDSVNTTVFIRIKGKLAALWPFLGICAEVAILCSIIFVYERRKSKSEREEADTDLPADNKHHDQRGKGQDVRQRK